MASRISNFRAYFHRKYTINGKDYDEGEREMAQLPNTRDDRMPDDINIYQGYTSGIDKPDFTDVYLDRFLGPNQYLAYSPGLVYLPKKYYTIADFLPQEWFGNFGDLIDVFNSFMDHVYSDKTVGRHRYYGNHFNPAVMFMNYDDVECCMLWNFFIDIWYDVVFNPQLQTYNLSFPNGGFSVYLRPTVFTYETPLSQIKMDIGSGNFPVWFGNTPDGYIQLTGNTKYVLADGFWAFDADIAGKGLNQYTPRAEFLSQFLVWLKNLYKMKFYFCTRGTTDTRYISDFNGHVTDSITIPNNSGRLERMYLLNDVSDCPNFGQNGFYMAGGGSNMSATAILNIYSNLVWKGGPPSNNPDNREDDPNDSDKKPNPEDKGGDGDHDDTDDKIIKPGLPTLSATGAGLITVFSPTVSQLSELGSKLWSPDALEAIKQYFSNPLDCVLGLSIIPVKPNTTSPKEILLGIYSTQVFAPEVISDYVIVDCGSIPITRYYGSYLDYSPYTHIKCYLPYIGEIDINPDEAMQKTLNIQYYVNVVTGDTVAMCFLDGDLFYTATGNCVRQLPLSSADYSSIINTAVSAVSTIATAAATAGVGNAAIEAANNLPHATDASKNLAAARAAGNNVSSSTSLLNNVMGGKMLYNHAGSLGTGAGQLSRQKPYLIIERPNLDLASNYKGFVGYPCNKTKQLSTCKGFTQIEASNIVVRDATDVELSMIKDLLMEGVIM